MNSGTETRYYRPRIKTRGKELPTCPQLPQPLVRPQLLRSSSGWRSTARSRRSSFAPEINRMFPNNGWLYVVLGVLALLFAVSTEGRLSYEPDRAEAPSEGAPSQR